MNSDPFTVLLELEQKAKQSARSFPQARQPETLFTGIGFRLDSHLLFMPFEDVREILSYPPMTPIPTTRKWLHGIAAIRGNLLPIVELSAALDGPKTPLSRKTRILAANYLGTSVGLLVEEVFGSKRFFSSERVLVEQPDQNWLSPYLTSAFVQEAQVWQMFSVLALEKSGALSRVLP